MQFIQSKEVPVQDLQYVAFDTETTGLDSASNQIVELSLYNINSKESYSTLLKPKFKDNWNSSFHRIQLEECLDAPSFADVYPYLEEYLKDKVLVAHNAAFDLSFLSQEVKRINKEFSARPFICTMEFRQMLSLPLYYDKHPLSWAAWQEGAYYDDRFAHFALADTFSCAGVLQSYLQYMQENNIKTLAQLMDKQDFFGLLPSSFSWKNPLRESKTPSLKEAPRKERELKGEKEIIVSNLDKTSSAEKKDEYRKIIEITLLQGPEHGRTYEYLASEAYKRSISKKDRREIHKEFYTEKANQFPEKEKSLNKLKAVLAL